MRERGGRVREDGGRDAEGGRKGRLQVLYMKKLGKHVSFSFGIESVYKGIKKFC